jgi:hypothetical protein
MPMIFDHWRAADVTYVKRANGRAGILRFPREAFVPQEKLGLARASVRKVG